MERSLRRCRTPVSRPTARRRVSAVNLDALGTSPVRAGARSGRWRGERSAAGPATRAGRPPGPRGRVRRRADRRRAPRASPGRTRAPSCGTDLVWKNSTRPTRSPIENTSERANRRFAFDVKTSESGSAHRWPIAICVQRGVRPIGVPPSPKIVGARLVRSRASSSMMNNEAGRRRSSCRVERVLADRAGRGDTLSP